MKLTVQTDSNWREEQGEYQDDLVWAHTRKNSRHQRKTAEVHVERAEHGHDDEVREDERPPAGPRAPESATEIGDEDPDLDRERSGERLTHRDPLAHLVFREPLPLLNELSLHLTAEGDGPAEPERAEAQEVGDEPADRDSRGRLRGLHGCPFHDRRAQAL